MIANWVLLLLLTLAVFKNFALYRWARRPDGPINSNLIRLAQASLWCNLLYITDVFSYADVFSMPGLLLFATLMTLTLADWFVSLGVTRFAKTDKTHTLLPKDEVARYLKNPALLLGVGYACYLAVRVTATVVFYVL